MNYELRIMRCCHTDLYFANAKYFHLGFNTNPKNGRVKALSKACLDRTYKSGLTRFIGALRGV